MKTITILAISFFALTTFSSCEKITDTTWMYYDETGCFDPWGHHDVPYDDKKKNVEKYLEEKGIKIFAVEISNDGTIDHCDACHCKTGKRIKCKVREKDITAMKHEKFY